MKIDGLIKKAGIAKEFTELDIKRMEYVDEKPEYYDGSTFEASGADLSDIFEKERTNKNGEPYVSRFAKLVLFNDNEEEKVSFSATFWNPAKDGVVKIKPNNPICNLIKFISNDYVNNQFDVDYEQLQKIVSEITHIKVKVRIIEVRNNFEVYGFDVEDIEFKDQ